MAVVDTQELEAKVRDMYRLVAEEPHGAYHFETERPLAERLGYPAELLDRVPAGALESFAGVGYFFDLTHLEEGQRVIDLGSGSGMDAFLAGELVGRSGRVVGIDFTVEQLEKARRLAGEAALDQVEFREGRIESPPAEDESFDRAISNGSSTSRPRRSGRSPRPHASCGRAAGWRSPTSSASSS